MKYPTVEHEITGTQRGANNRLYLYRVDFTNGERHYIWAYTQDDVFAVISDAGMHWNTWTVDYLANATNRDLWVNGPGTDLDPGYPSGLTVDWINVDDDWPPIRKVVYSTSGGQVDRGLSRHGQIRYVIDHHVFTSLDMAMLHAICVRQHHNVNDHLDLAAARLLGLCDNGYTAQPV